MARKSRSTAAKRTIPGSERKLADLAAPPRFDRLSWSPDGNFLAFVDRDLQKGGTYVFLLSIETGAKRMLEGPPSDLQDQYSPVFSPDGRTIAFLQGTLALPDIRVMPVAAGASRPLTRRFGDVPAALTWTSDSREIVFSSYQDGLAGLWRIPVVGGIPRRIGRAGENAFAPSISRQGDLVFARAASLPTIRRVELQGGSRRAVSFIVSSAGDENPQYSPDGTQIAFASSRSGSGQVWLSDSEGRNPLQLTFMGTETDWISWSPDGRQLAFNSDANGQWNLYTIAVEGGPAHHLTRDHAHESSRPSWSPDGEWIYYQSDRSGAFQIWKVPSGGGLPIQVTKRGGSQPLVSPDGKFVYYTNARQGPGIWRVRSEGGDEKHVLERIHNCSGNLAVVSNGVYFVDAEYHAIKFFSFDTERITDVVYIEKMPSNAPLSVSPDGRYLLYASEDRFEGDLMLAKNFR
jgi:Tol biopolymer transport system component